MPKVSVVMPCFNHAQFVAEAAQSVLRQTHTDLELIITDDRSSDNSWEVMSRIADGDARVKLIRHQQNQGLPKSRNDALAESRGEFIAFCDSDDVWEPEKIRMQVKLLEENPEFDMVYCDTLIIDENGSLTGQRFSERHPLPKRSTGWLFPELVRGNFINVQSALMRRRCLASIDHFDEELGVLEDWWYWVQLSRKHRFLYSPELLARYRVHSQSMNSMKKRSFPIFRCRIYRKILRQYGDLSSYAKAEIFYAMGVDLCSLGKPRIGRRLLWNALRFSSTNAASLGRLCKTAVRLAQTLDPFRSKHQPYRMLGR
jgi:teichuronic acid biosynthesis glycosyltransferase TuaG